MRSILKNIHLIGIILWIIIFFVTIPFKLIKKNKIILIGFFYTIFILIMNILLIGNKKDDEFSNNNIKEVVFYDIESLLNIKSVEISSAIFAIAVATKSIFHKTIYRNILIFIIYTLIFGVGIVIPEYFINNHYKEKIHKYHKIIISLRNVSLSYSIGFMICCILFILNRILSMKK